VNALNAGNPRLLLDKQPYLRRHALHGSAADFHRGAIPVPILRNLLSEVAGQDKVDGGGTVDEGLANRNDVAVGLYNHRGA